jgi:carboxymethylenebutenolidase
MPAFEAALKKANKLYALHLYEDAMHIFENDTSEARYNNQAAEQAWSRTIVFYRFPQGTSASLRGERDPPG